MTTDEPTQLDADEISCRKCLVGPGEVCRQPNGAKARAIHVARRRDALAGNRPRLPDKQTPRGTTRNPPGTAEGRSKGGRKTAQERRRRKSEIAAQVEAARAEAEAEAIAREADKLARDASKYATDRSQLRALTLKNAAGVARRLDEAVTHLHRPRGYADDGRPLTIKVELFDRKTGLPAFDPKTGDRIFEEVADVIGWTSVSMIETLSKAAAQQLASVRLEEGKPTGIHEHLGAGVADTLGDRETAELIRFAHEFYTDKEGTP